MEIIYFQLSEKGKRQNNEDSIYPKKGIKPEVDGLFMVCDGVGGAEKGEIASSICVSAISEFFRVTLGIGDFPDENFVQEAIAQAERGMGAWIDNNPDSRGMATTLTLAFISGNRALLAHVGDSRIYHIRNGNILHVTRDHSLVNDLVASGAITPEKALTHPKKNVITRAITGTKDSTLADYHLIGNLMPGDFLLLCSDGILESIDETFLKDNFVISGSKGLSVGFDTFTEHLSQIRKDILDACTQNSRDNFSAVIIGFYPKPGEIAETPPVVQTSENEISATETPVQTTETVKIQIEETEPITPVPVVPELAETPAVTPVLVKKPNDESHDHGNKKIGHLWLWFSILTGIAIVALIAFTNPLERLKKVLNKEKTETPAVQPIIIKNQESKDSTLIKQTDNKAK